MRVYTHPCAWIVSLLAAATMTSNADLPQEHSPVKAPVATYEYLNSSQKIDQAIQDGERIQSSIFRDEANGLPLNESPASFYFKKYNRWEYWITGGSVALLGLYGAKRVRDKSQQMRAEAKRAQVIPPTTLYDYFYQLYDFILLKDLENIS